MSRPEEVLDKALRPCSCAFGLSENLRVNRKCENHAALITLTDELERAKQAHEVLDAKLTQARSELAAKDARVKEVEDALREERRLHGEDEEHIENLEARLKEAEAALRNIHVVSTTYADGGRGPRVTVNISPESYDRLSDALSNQED